MGTEENYEIKPRAEEIFWKLNPIAQKLTLEIYCPELFELSGQFDLMAAHNLKDCESPLEQVLTLVVYKAMLKVKKVYEDNQKAVIDWWVSTQDKIKANSKIYRADVLLSIYDDRFTPSGIIFECDGHNFHEKTKEQAAHDKKRDRDLINAGYVVIRFTGSEIFNNASNLADEIKSIILSQMKK